MKTKNLPVPAAIVEALDETVIPANVNLGGVVLEAKAKVTSWVKSAVKGDLTSREAIHQASVQCVAHAGLHGDYDMIKSIVSGLKVNRSQNLKGLAFALEMFTPLTVDLKSGDVKYHKASSVRGQRIIAARGFLWDVEGFAANKFWDLDGVVASNEKGIGAFTTNNIVRLVAGAEVKSIASFVANKVNRLDADNTAKVLADLKAVFAKHGLDTVYAEARDKAQAAFDEKKAA